MKWQRERHGEQVQGEFQRTPDENVWRIVEKSQDKGESLWTGLMSVYVDDLLLVAESEVLDAATQAISEVWAISDVEKTGEGNIVKYCGFEIEQAVDQSGLGDGFVVSQKKYEKEMVQRFGVERSSEFPRFHLTEEDETPKGEITSSDVKDAQSRAGALLWLSTRTRPDGRWQLHQRADYAPRTQSSPSRSQMPSCSTSMVTLEDFTILEISLQNHGEKEAS